MITGDATLFSFLKRTQKTEGLIGVGIQDAAISLAQVVRTTGSPPRLLLCEHQICAESASVRSALEAMLKDHHLQQARAVTVMAPGSFSLLLVEAPEVDPTELKAAVRWRIKDMLDFHIDDAVIDVFDIPGQKERGRTHMMYVVAARANLVQSRIDLLEQSSLALDVIDIPELTQRNVAALLPEDGAGVALLSFSDGAGLITLSQHATLYLARGIDVGLDALVPGPADNDVVSTPAGLTLDTPFAPASEGLSFGDITLEHRRAFDSIVLEIQRSFDYYESHFSQPPISALVISPLEREVPGIVEYLATNLGVAVRMLDLNAVLESAQVLDSAMQARCLPAIGAALRHEEKVL